MRPQSFYAAFAVILPVALGLGLVYLSSVGRIDATVAVVSTLAIAVVMAIGIRLRDGGLPGDLDRGDEADR
jgi:hypothetical protein